MHLGRWAVSLGILALASVAFFAGPASGDSSATTPAGLIVNGPTTLPLDGNGIASITSPAFDVPEASVPENEFQLVIHCARRSDGFNMARATLNGVPVLIAPGGPGPGYPQGTPPLDTYTVPIALRTTGNVLNVFLQGQPNGTGGVKIECVSKPAIAARAPSLRTLCIATAYITKNVDAIVAIRNDNDGAPIAVRVLLYAPNGALVTTSDVVPVPANGREHISVSKIVLAKAAAWARGSVIVQVVGRGSADVCADAVQVNRKDLDAATLELKGSVPGTARNLPVEDKGTRPLTPEQASQILGD